MCEPEYHDLIIPLPFVQSSAPIHPTYPGDMNYRRAKIPGGTFFFTVVTHNRRPFLCTDENIALLRQAFRYAMSNHPFKPVRHNLVSAPIEWAYSSFGRYVQAGVYPADWGAEGSITFPDNVGHE